MEFLSSLSVGAVCIFSEALCSSGEVSEREAGDELPDRVSSSGTSLLTGRSGEILDVGLFLLGCNCWKKITLVYRNLAQTSQAVARWGERNSNRGKEPVYIVYK